MAKKRVGKFPKAFRQMAVDRLTQSDNIVELAKELGISRRLLYTWREKLEPRRATDHRRIHARPLSGKRSANSSGCWLRRCWKSIFSMRGKEWGRCLTLHFNNNLLSAFASALLRPQLLQKLGWCKVKQRPSSCIRGS
ncbi:MAG: transposase [Nitrospirae bacterium]|nr:transposase [Nitrospirota bacterium]